MIVRYRALMEVKRICITRVHSYFFGLLNTPLLVPQNGLRTEESSISVSSRY